MSFYTKRNNPSKIVIRNVNTIVIIAGDRYVIESDGLLIKNVDYNDAGTYTCRARVMETGSLEERDIKLEVMKINDVKTLVATSSATATGLLIVM